MPEITEPSTAEIAAATWLCGANPSPRPAAPPSPGSGRYAVTAAGDAARHDDIVTFTIQLTAPDGEVSWDARVFLLLGADGRIREDYQLTVKPLAG